MAAFQNIKILHKRYTAAEWTNGVLVNGQTIIPTLALGEIGLATDTFELRIGTNKTAEQNFKDARLINEPVTILKKDALGEAISDTSNMMITDVSVERNAATSAYTLTYVYKPIPTVKVTQMSSADVVGAGEVEVVASLSYQNAAGSHEIIYTSAAAATKAYVDDLEQKHDDELKDLIDNRITPIENGKLSEITASDDDVVIAEVTGTGVSRNIDVKHKTFSNTAVPEKEETAGAGDTVTIPIQEITYDTYGHVTGSKTQKFEIAIPDPTAVPDATVGTHTNTSTDVLTQIKRTNGVLSGSNKAIAAVDGSKVSVTGTDTQIQIGVDLSAYATKDELSASVNGATHYAGAIEVSGIWGRPTDLSTLTSGDSNVISDFTNGALYMLINGDKGFSKGSIKDSRYPIHDHRATSFDGSTPAGNEVQVESGDMLLFHIGKNDSHWDLIPAADDIEYRPIKVNGTELLGINSSTAVDFKAGNDGVVVGSNAGNEIVISHKSNSTEDLSKTARTYVDGLTFDAYGHVTGYTVGEETVVDTNTAHSHTAPTSGKLTVTGAGGIDGTVTYDHAKISTTTTADSTKNVAVTPGSNVTFTVVDSLVDDTYGHITGVKTKEVTISNPADTNTLYDIKGEADGTTGAKVTLTPSSTFDAPATASNVQFTGEDGTTVSFKNGKIVISSHDTTYELATDALAGLIKVAKVLTTVESSNAATLQNFTGNNDNRLYGVNRKADGTTFVEVPWTDTTYTASNGLKVVGTDVQHNAAATADANKTVDMYAFGTDNYGHATGMIAITTIDGNLA